MLPGQKITFLPFNNTLRVVIVPALCVYEVFKLILAQRGEEAALQAAGIMSPGTTANLTPEIAIEAARISLDLKIAMADRIILATTQAYTATRLT